MSPGDESEGPDNGLPLALLLVDDDQVLRDRLARAFRDRGLLVFTASNYDEAVAVATAQAPDLAVLDLRMPGRSGLELVKALKSIDSSTKVVVLTGYGSIATALEAVRLGALHYLPKPADVEEILAAFDRPNAKSLSGTEAPAPTLARAEWEHIQRILADCHGNISEAARRLGIHRRSLQRKLQKHPPRS